MLALYQARLVRGPVPDPRPLLVVALYDTVYATGELEPTRARAVCPSLWADPDRPAVWPWAAGRGTSALPPNTDKVAGPWKLFGNLQGGFAAPAQQVGNADPDYYETKVHCRRCNYRSRVPGHAARLCADGHPSMRHPPGRTVVHADVTEAPVPHARTRFDFDRGCLVGGDDAAIVLIYGSPRARLTDRYLDRHLGPAKRSYHGRDGALYGALYVVRAS